MAWYRTGTVAVTNGSTTVTGTGTAWVANTAAGQIFSAPDGRIYEILSVNSDVQLTLGKAYLGATASGQAYEIAPTQDYMRSLAAQAATLINDYSAVKNAAGAGKFGDGTVAQPGIAFVSDTDTGIRRVGANTGALVAAGADVVQFGPDKSVTFVIDGASAIIKSNAFGGAIRLAANSAAAGDRGVRVGTVDNNATFSAILSLEGGLAGIGVTAPTAGMHVNAHNASYIAKFERPEIAGQRLALYNGQDNFYIDAEGAGNQLALSTNGGVRMRLSSTSVVPGLTNTTDFGADNIRWKYGYFHNGVSVRSGVGGQIVMVPGADGTYTGRLEFYSSAGARHGYIGHSVGEPGADLGTVPFVMGTAAFNNNLTVSGYLSAGWPAGASAHVIAHPAQTVGNTQLSLPSTGAFYVGDSGGENAAATVLSLKRNFTTGRSISAAGTISASGADYAEYMRKAPGCGAIAKGAIVGVDSAGLLTDVWDNAKSFLVKSTDPSYVGGDVWGSEEAIGMARPVEPVAPGPAPTEPQFVADFAPKRTAYAEGDEGDAEYASAMAEHNSGEDARRDALQAAHADRTAAHAAAVSAYNAARATYEADRAEFESRLEAARAQVDRIAYAGQVPCNVLGAQPGDYIVPIRTDSGGISGVARAKDAVTLMEYVSAVGVVHNVLDDGRAFVRVKSA